MTIEFAVRPSVRNRGSRGAQSSAWLVGCFFAIVVDFGQPMMLIAPYTFYLLASVLGGALNRGVDVIIFGSAVGAASLGLAWISMAHLARCVATCAVLQLGAVVAFTVAAGIVALRSENRLLAALSTIPFSVAAAIKIASAVRLLSRAERGAWQFSLRQLFWFASSLALFVLPIAEALHIPVERPLDPKTATARLTAYSADGAATEVTTVSYYDYLSGKSPLIESAAYRSERNIKRVVVEVLRPDGAPSRFENFYADNGDLIDSESAESKNAENPSRRENREDNGSGRPSRRDGKRTENGSERFNEHRKL